MLNIGSKKPNKTKNYGLIICMSFANRPEEYFKNRSVKQTGTFFIKKKNTWPSQNIKNTLIQKSLRNPIQISRQEI